MGKINNPPVVELRKADPLQDAYYDGEGNYWGVARLIDLVKDEKEFLIPLAGLNLSSCVWSGSDMMMLAFHCKKVFDADLDIPIIIAWDGVIADGRHRVIRALIDGETTIKAVRMTWRPTPCRTEKND